LFGRGERSEQADKQTKSGAPFSRALGWRTALR